MKKRGNVKKSGKNVTMIEEYKKATNICEKAKMVGITQFSPSLTMDDEINNISKKIRKVK